VRDDFPPDIPIGCDDKALVYAHTPTSEPRVSISNFDTSNGLLMRSVGPISRTGKEKKEEGQQLHADKIA
jgi:hypothetical protein